MLSQEVLPALKQEMKLEWDTEARFMIFLERVEAKEGIDLRNLNAVAFQVKDFSPFPHVDSNRKRIDFPASFHEVESQLRIALLTMHLSLPSSRAHDPERVCMIRDIITWLSGRHMAAIPLSCTDMYALYAICIFLGVPIYKEFKERSIQLPPPPESDHTQESIQGRVSILARAQKDESKISKQLGRTHDSRAIRKNHSRGSFELGCLRLQRAIETYLQQIADEKHFQVTLTRVIPNFASITQGTIAVSSYSGSKKTELHHELQQCKTEIERLRSENEMLRRENAQLLRSNQLPFQPTVVSPLQDDYC